MCFAASPIPSLPDGGNKPGFAQPAAKASFPPAAGFHDRRGGSPGQHVAGCLLVGSPKGAREPRRAPQCVLWGCGVPALSPAPEAELMGFQLLQQVLHTRPMKHPWVKRLH